MSHELHSILVDYSPDPKTKPVQIADFYRVWTQDGEKKYRLANFFNNRFPEPVG